MTVSGAGRLPLVYAASRTRSPWIEIRLGDKIRAVDTKEGAVVYDKDNRVVARYPAGSFFKGLGRPWLGLHTIDTVRRDAAGQELPFQTQYDSRTDLATVVVQSEPMALTYTIDMTRDLISRLDMSSTTVTGELMFTYLEEEDSSSNQFAEPRVAAGGPTKSNTQGVLWLLDVLGTYGQAKP